MPKTITLGRQYYYLYNEIYSWLREHTKCEWNKGYSIQFGYQYIDLPERDLRLSFLRWLRQKRIEKR